MFELVIMGVAGFPQAGIERVLGGPYLPPLRRGCCFATLVALRASRAAFMSLGFSPGCFFRKPLRMSFRTVCLPTNSSPAARAARAASLCSLCCLRRSLSAGVRVDSSTAFFFFAMEEDGEA